MKSWILNFLLLFMPLLLEGYETIAPETIIAADKVHYDGELITLSGHVSVENAMGRVTAQQAFLRKDGEKLTQIDFPWVDLKHEVTLMLAEGGVLKCESVFLIIQQKQAYLWAALK